MKLFIRKNKTGQLKITLLNELALEVYNYCTNFMMFKVEQTTFKSGKKAKVIRVSKAFEISNKDFEVSLFEGDFIEVTI